MPNRLADELSPYLLQHAGNPVEWWPWCAEALAAARERQRPIFLSIGYASCHWCHVMAHESFEDPTIARLLNEHFVSIKVDREERPDLDMIYMAAVQLLTGHGGWPMSVFLTPSGEPFFGGTYWPARARGGMPGFDRVLLAVADAWQNQREELVAQAGELTRVLQAATESDEANRGVRADTRADVEEEEGTGACEHAPHVVIESALRDRFDATNGGFGSAPKFPEPLALQWLLQRWRRTGDQTLLKMVTTTLDHMAASGIFDQLGGGFHRYTVDANWLTPHFEKMLYDNAMLVVCYLEAWQATGVERYADVARQTLDYLLRDMANPLGGFYSSEDADSEGEEGKFYLWTPNEVEAAIGPEAAIPFCRVYDVTDAGNFEGRNILHVSHPLETESRTLSRAPQELKAELAQSRQALLAARSHRVRPARDEKVMVFWNGLVIDAMARAGAAIGEPRYTTAAERAADFLLTHVRADERLLHYWRAGRPKQAAFLDDYAGLANALLTLHENGSQQNRLADVTALADEILARFADPRGGGFFFTPSDHESLIVRLKDAVDNPVPSGNGLAAKLFLRLAAITGRQQYRDAAKGTFRACLPWIERAPLATFQLSLAMDAAISRSPASM